jgi:homoserine kinase
VESIKIFAPATVANLSCGYDAMGLALKALGDYMLFTKTSTKGVRIRKIYGADLPYEADKNVASVVAKLLLDDAKVDFGLDIEIWKNFKPGSGLGSSAASGAGAAFAVNQLLGSKYNKLELTKFAMQGEVAACGWAIADNVAACIYGGFVLVRSYDPLDIISIPTPSDLAVTIIHPQIEIKTEDARKVVPDSIPIKTAVSQWANVGGLISGLYSSNYDLIGASIQDFVVEPQRKLLIPKFDDVKKAALESGAFGAGISGSGPSIFALSKGDATAQQVAEAMDLVYASTGIDYNMYVSNISKNGSRIL